MLDKNMVSLAACGTGFLLDLMFGDPRWLYHPVRLIGHLISGLERILRKWTGGRERSEKTAGFIMWILVVSVSALIPLLLLMAAGQINPWLRYAVESFMCYQLLATKALKDESMKVYEELKKEDLEGARRAVSMIVGRDTASLTEEGVTKAAVETVAENTSDGIIAPLFYMVLGGAPLAFTYKAVNTMDSMVGYKNDRYLHFGCIPAKLDDVFNYIPARISAYLMIASAYLGGMDGKNAYRIYRRDKRKHASPNAAQTEAVCAGALRVGLAGDAYYFGKLYKKETIGDALRPVEYEDIKRANKLLYGTAILAMLVFGGLKLLVMLGIG